MIADTITQAAPATTEGKAETPGAGSAEAASIHEPYEALAYARDEVRKALAPALTTDAPDKGWQIAGAGVAPGPFHHLADALAGVPSHAHTKVYTDADAMIADILADTDDHGADLLPDAGTQQAEAEAAEFASWTAGPVEMIEAPAVLHDPELMEIIRWAYSKLHAREFADMEDALMLDRMKLLLTGEVL